MITVKQLKKLLKKIPDDTQLVLQKDDEGNGYRYMNYMNGIDFEERGHSASNLYDGEYDGECIRQSDTNDDRRQPQNYPHVVAVIF